VLSSFSQGSAVIFERSFLQENSADRHVYTERLLLLLSSCVMLATLQGIKLPNINYPNNMLLLNHDAAILQKSCGKIWLAAQYQRVKRSSGCKRGVLNAGKSTRCYLWCPYVWLCLLKQYDVSLFSFLVRYVNVRVCTIRTYVYALSYAKNYMDS
jgi:hypothetical protein